MARLLVGVSGGIAAYKAAELVRLATKEGHAVRVLVTPDALRFVGKATLAALSGAPVLVGPFEEDPLRGAFPGHRPPAEAPIDHLALAAGADLYLIAPATANTVAKLARGFADNLLLAAALACAAPLVVAPAMNERMYLHPATAENLDLLRSRGVWVVGPERGPLAGRAEGEGWGRMVEPATLLEFCRTLLGPPSWLKGRTVLISAGGTREPFDAVRYIGNRSSGLMGFALAEAALGAGARVELVAANVALPDPPGARVVRVGRAAELEAAMVEAQPRADLVVMAAAVADFAPANPLPGKLKREGVKELVLTLEPTNDILGRLLRARRPGQLVVGFAAEHGPDGLAQARAKLLRKGVDALIYNDVSNPALGFEAKENELVVLSEKGERSLGRAPKRRLAWEVLAALGDLLGPDGAAETS